MPCQQAPTTHAPSPPQVRLGFIPSLPHFSWAATIAPSIERELGETLALDTRCLLLVPVRDASEPLGSPPSILQSPDYVHKASPQQGPSYGSPSAETIQGGAMDKPRTSTAALKGSSLPDPAAHPFPTTADRKLQRAEQRLGESTRSREVAVGDVYTDPRRRGTCDKRWTA